MSEHPNAALVRQAYQAFAAGDLPAIRARFAARASWHSAGRNWLVGDYHGPDAIIGFLQAVFAYSEGTYTTDIHDILANDRRAVALQRSSARRSDGRSLSVDAAVVFDIADGAIERVRAWPYDLYAEDAFYGPEPPRGFSSPDRR
jgi:ketosteroid isomerase-like protein